MDKNETQTQIENSFRMQVQRAQRVKNAYLLVDSEKLDIRLNIAAGATGEFQADCRQPIHLASVGKFFTATVFSILYEKGLLDFNDPIAKYLADDIMNRLHVFKGKDYSDQITIRHLLMQTSGLNDVFYHFFEKFTEYPGFRTTPREAIFWCKENLSPVSVPGRKHFYTDTNYYLLGLIIEKITKKKFHEAMHELIFEPLNMNQSWVHGFSQPKIPSDFPTARLYIKKHDLLAIAGIHEIDYAGGSIIAPLSDFLVFMKAVTSQKIIKSETLNRMIEDDIWMGFPTVGFRYGYSLWKPVIISGILPAQYFCWGCVGVTGAFMFYHPATESNIIGTFNDFSYRGKALEFMIKKVIRKLLILQ